MSTQLQAIPRDEKQYDATPEGIRATVNEFTKKYNQNGVVFHYTSGAKLELIEKSGIRCGKGKEGGGLYFFRKGPDQYGFHGRRYGEKGGQADPATGPDRRCT